MSGKYIRAFIALDLSQPVKKYLEGQIRGMKKTSVPGIKWVRTEDLHITLKFLGNITHDQIPLIEQCLTRIMAGHTPIKTILTGIGFFPSENKARVLWVGFNDPGGSLAMLADNIDKTLNGLGLPKENKKFLAHATLARLNARSTVNTRLKELSLLSVPTDLIETFDHITLYQSTLTPQGAIYQVMKVF